MFNRIKNKVLSGKRLTAEDALKLFKSDDIFLLGTLASYAAEKKNGRKVYFIRNRHINPTNICVNRCRFCAFSRSKSEEGAFELTIEDIIDKLRAQNAEHRTKNKEQRTQSTEHRTQNIEQRTKNKELRMQSPHSPQRIRLSAEATRRGGTEPCTRSGTGELATPYTEVHIVGGLHPEWTFEYYLEMVSTIKKHFPELHIKAFTAVEVDHFSKISGLPLKETLKRLKASGLDAMPGGGAEIFTESVRKRLCPEKITGKRWLEVMETAHKVGLKTNATMLYGHIEDYTHRIDHLLQLRKLQDRTGGFQAFIPLSYHPKNTRIKGGLTSGIDDLKTIAISRLMLDNFDHIKAYWVMLGEKISQLALLFGADDIDGTIIEEKITHSAGALTEGYLTADQLVNLIKKAGRIPVERDSFYNAVIPKPF